MIGRRLLMGGGGAFVIPSTTFELIASDAAYTWPPDPKFIYYNGKTYFGWVDMSSRVRIASYDHATQTVSTPFTLKTLAGPDIHNSPAILIRDSDKRLVVAYAGHNTTTCWLRISTNPEDVSAFGTEVSLDAQLGGTTYTYMGLVQLTGVVNDPIFLFYRDYTASFYGDICYSISTDNAATWAAQTRIYRPDTAVNRAYRRVTSNGVDRIDLITTNNDRTVGDPSSILHMYYSAGDWHTTDGTVISTALPFHTADLTLVKDASEGPCNPDGVSYDGSGNPIALYSIYDPSPVQQSLVRFSKWNGSAWVESSVADTGGVVPAGSNFNVTAGINHRLFDGYVYVSKKVGTKLELFRYASTDGGTTWAGTQVTFSSPQDNVLVDTVYDGIAGLRAIFLQGVYTDQDNFDFAIMAAT